MGQKGLSIYQTQSQNAPSPSISQTEEHRHLPAGCNHLGVKSSNTFDTENWGRRSTTEPFRNVSKKYSVQMKLVLLFASWKGLGSPAKCKAPVSELAAQWQTATRAWGQHKRSQAELKYPCWSTVPWGHCYVLPETKRRAHFQSQRLLCPIKENSRLQLEKKQEKETQPQCASLHPKGSLKKEGMLPGEGCEHPLGLVALVTFLRRVGVCPHWDYPTPMAGAPG